VLTALATTAQRFFHAFLGVTVFLLLLLKIAFARVDTSTSENDGSLFRRHQQAARPSR
jgi:hypothetical protein